MKTALLINDTGFVFHFGCQTVIQNINELCSKNNIKIIESLILEEKNKIKKIKKIIINKKINIIILNGEGTIHHNSKEGIELLKIGKYIKENFKNIKIFIINSTFQEIDKYLYLLKYFDLISVRDPYSKDYLIKNKIECFITPDLSLYKTKYNFKEKFNKKIIYGGSVLKEVDNVLNKNKNYKDIYYFPKGNNYIPYIFIKKSIYVILHKIFHFFTYPFKNKKIKYIKNSDNYIKKLNENDYLISGRFHDIYMSLKAGINFYFINSNSYKIKSTLEYIGLENRIIDLNSIKDIELKSFNSNELNKINNFILKGNKDIEDLFIKISKIG